MASKHAYPIFDRCLKRIARFDGPFGDLVADAFVNGLGQLTMLDVPAEASPDWKAFRKKYFAVSGLDSLDAAAIDAIRHFEPKRLADMVQELYAIKQLMTDPEVDAIWRETMESD